MKKLTEYRRHSEWANGTDGTVRIDYHDIPAPVCEALDALVEAADVVHRGWHEFDDAFGGPYGECEGVPELLDALHALAAAHMREGGNKIDTNSPEEKTDE